MAGSGGRLDGARTKRSFPVAMIRVEEGLYELAKMAVANSHQKRGIGELLGRAGIDWARRKGATMIFLQTNSSLANSIRLYERLGFRHAVDPDPPDYARADVYMELPIAQGRRLSKPCTRASSRDSSSTARRTTWKARRNSGPRRSA